MARRRWAGVCWEHGLVVLGWGCAGWVGVGLCAEGWCALGMGLGSLRGVLRGDCFVRQLRGIVWFEGLVRTWAFSLASMAISLR